MPFLLAGHLDLFYRFLDQGMHIVIAPSKIGLAHGEELLFGTVKGVENISRIFIRLLYDL
jgi:hypothetical protein